jgi:hypothetical protein
MREREPDQEREEETDEATKPAGGDDEHSDAPGPHGTGEAYPRGDRPEED